MDIIMVDKDLEYCESLKRFLKVNGDMNIIKFFDNFSDASKYIEKNNNTFDLLLLDTAVPNINLDKMIDILPHSCNVIAFTDNISTFNEYINAPFFQRIFQKPVSFSAISNYLCTQNNIENYANIRKKVLKKLSQIGFSIRHTGTTYLADGVIFAIKNKVKKLSEIYTFVAYKYNTEPRIITWSINNAINKAFKDYDESLLEESMNLQKGHKITAKYIINYLVNYDY